MKTIYNYGLYGWDNSQRLVTLSKEYSSITEALNDLENALIYGCYNALVLRRETIYERTETSEISISTPIFNWERKYYPYETA